MGPGAASWALWRINLIVLAWDLSSDMVRAFGIESSPPYLLNLMDFPSDRCGFLGALPLLTLTVAMTQIDH